MSEIVKVTNEKIQTISSREVAEMMEMNHKDLLRKIDGINEEQSNINMDKYWLKNTYKDSRGKTWREFLVSLDGIDILIKRSRKTQKLKRAIEFLKQHEYKNKEIVLSKRFEESFGHNLKNTLKALDIDVEDQKYCLGYRIDFYIPKYKIAIEYDEYQHKYTKDADYDRQHFLSIELGCTFLRLDYEQEDSYNVGLVIKEVLKKGGYKC